VTLSWIASPETDDGEGLIPRLDGSMTSIGSFDHRVGAGVMLTRAENDAAPTGKLPGSRRRGTDSPILIRMVSRGG